MSKVQSPQALFPHLSIFYSFSKDEKKRNETVLLRKLSFSSFLFSCGCFIMRCQFFNTLETCLLRTKCSSHSGIQKCCFLLLGYSGGCVVMRGRSPPGRWEVKDCRHFKAMSLCKQPVGKQEKTEQEERWPFHPCYLDWESEPGLASCFKVMPRVPRHSQWDEHYFSLGHVSSIPLLQNSAWHRAAT